MANEDRFSGLANGYKKYRPSYSREAIEYLVSKYALADGAQIVDVGCGTGLLSELFLERGFRVYGVEPNEDMRERAKEYLAEYSNFTAIDGNDADFGDMVKTADLVTCAQAFHWFDTRRFKAECRRVLKEDGAVAIFYADFDPNAEMTEDLRRLNYNCAKDKEVAWKVRLAYSERYLAKFFVGEFESRVFENSFSYDFDGFLGLMDSYSFNPREGDPLYPGYYEKVKDFFQKYSIKQNDGLRVSYPTNLYLGGGYCDTSDFEGVYRIYQVMYWHG